MQFTKMPDMMGLTRVHQNKLKTYFTAVKSGIREILPQNIT